MNKIDLRYWIELPVLTAVLALAGWLAFTRLFPGTYPPGLPILGATLVIATVAGQIWLTGLLDKKFNKFNSSFMIYKALKMFLLLTVMVILSLTDRDHAVPLVISTLILYLAYMIFEARSLNRHSRRQAKQ